MEFVIAAKLRMSHRPLCGYWLFAGQQAKARPVARERWQMAMLNKDVVVLAIGQALTSTVVSLLTSVSSLSGAYLAPNPALSTVPVTATVLGTLITIYPASSLMSRFGRRGGFLLKAVLGIGGGVLCSAALIAASFALLIAGAFLLGMFSAFGQYYRFAAIDAAQGPEQRASAVAIVTGAGVVGGFAGPFIGGHFADVFASVPYMGAFLALSLVCVCLAASQFMLSADLGRNAVAATATATAHAERFVPRACFAKASAICAVGFAVMTLTMNAAPLSMQGCGFSLPVSSAVLQVHFVLMYLPSLFNPALISFLGLRGLVAGGIVASATGCLLTHLAEQTFAVYVLELGLSGLGWNFIFNGGTLLLVDTYAPVGKTKAQGLNSLFVYGANLVASFSAGALMASRGWEAVNLACLPLLAIACIALWQRRSVKIVLP
jgi:MFS family permease